jgi:hypothetical protein
VQVEEEEGYPPVDVAELRHDLTNHEDFWRGTVLNILQVERDDKGTGYTYGSLTIALVTWDASSQGLRFSG